jgi:hypothetical protein
MTNKNIIRSEKVLVPSFEITGPLTQEQIKERNKVKRMLLKNAKKDWQKYIEDKEKKIIKILCDLNKGVKNDKV